MIERKRESSMGEYLKRSDGVNVKNRATAEDLQLISSKKRKVSVELGNEHYDVGLPENLLSPAASLTSVSSEYDAASSAGGITDDSNSRSPDLKSEDFETEISTPINCLFREENEICGDSKQGLMYASSTSNRNSPPHREISAVKMPSESELEEFFAAAEKSEQKRFAEKYNYDIVKDIPLEEGKYQWVRLHP